MKTRVVSFPTGEEGNPTRGTLVDFKKLKTDEPKEDFDIDGEAHSKSTPMRVITSSEQQSCKTDAPWRTSARN